MMAALGFLTSPLGKLVAGALFVASAYTAGYWKGHSRAAAASEVASLKSQIVVLKADAETAKQSAALAERQAKASDLLATENQRRVDELANAKSCPLSRDDARRLRNIR